MAYMVMAYLVIVYVVMVYIVMAYTVMAYTDNEPSLAWIQKARRRVVVGWAAARAHGRVVGRVVLVVAITIQAITT